MGPLFMAIGGRRLIKLFSHKDRRFAFTGVQDGKGVTAQRAVRGMQDQHR